MKCYGPCKLELDRNAFAPSQQDRAGAKCKDCTKLYSKEHYLQHKDRYTSMAGVKRAQYLAVNYRRYCTYLKSHPCVDCQESNILFLEPDHLRDKSFNLSEKLPYVADWSLIEKELEKCEIRCLHCHRLRTMKEGNWIRYRIWQQMNRESLATTSYAPVA